MSDRTKIEWTRSDDGTPGATWNPVTGCTKLSPASPGCQNCYASTFAERFRGTPGHYFEHGFDVQLRPDKLDQPLRWRRPRRIFVNSMSDLFHADVPDDYIAHVWAVMARAQHHTFQVLTKRHSRMRSLLASDLFRRNMYDHLVSIDYAWIRDTPLAWPLPNVWLGVSAENQQWAEIRGAYLRETPAAVRFYSCEPLLGPIETDLAGIDWVIVGGESGPGARPMHPYWARSLRDQCAAAGVPFLFKQWGEWAPFDPDAVTGCRPDVYLRQDGSGDGTYYARRYHPGVEHLCRVGKKLAGRELDGRTWDQYPEAVSS
ncbi:DUF5131 family protein [Mycolicibacterium fortuitum]|uniref:DUF5131 family protein n=1 Tax=Mycolicibacterium fortuitum TaxID=1766 RepID=UPI00096D4186|nr:phage Gp37/Gp68 family protein [Mycolicibacterium fortuitum]OMC07080.1 hypothetical protein A5734_03730 [Mycolicibacterium fortuitum]